MKLKLKTINVNVFYHFYDEKEKIAHKMLNEEYRVKKLWPIEAQARKI